MGEPPILAELEVAQGGKGVQVEFTKLDDLISHAIYVVNSGEKTPVLISQINEPGQPCFTELHQQGDTLFLTGAGGPCHWSMSVGKGEMIFKHDAKIDHEMLQLLEERYGLKVVVGTHPIPQKYLDMHTRLGTWEDPAWRPLLEPTMADEATRVAYN